MYLELSSALLLAYQSDDGILTFPKLDANSRPHIDGAWPASGLDPVTVSFFYQCILPLVSKTDRLQSSTGRIPLRLFTS